MKRPKDIISPLLAGNEKIVWCARPEPEKDEMRLTIIETVAITLIAAVMASGIVVQCNGWLVLAFCIAAMLHTAYMVIWGTLLPQRRNKFFENIVYGLTNSRLLIYDENSGAMRECQFSEMSVPQVVDKHGIVGTIVFDDNLNNEKKVKDTDLLHKNCLKNVDSVDVVVQDLKRCMGKGTGAFPVKNKGGKKSSRK